MGGIGYSGKKYLVGKVKNIVPRKRVLRKNRSIQKNIYIFNSYIFTH
jgi:hypothetical protein